ncbi:MAG: hypothetical protein ACJATV_000547 [Granulosicoccus sp.]|jgi:hypothetical protein
MKFNKGLSAALISSCLLAGCISAPKTTYHWGQYEKLLHDMYMVPGEATSIVQIEKITTDIQQAEALGKPVPPGVYAHLGYMYSIEGNNVAATDAFNTEKSLYPDSQTLIDGMLKRAEDFKKQL